MCKNDSDIRSVLPSNLVTAPCWLNTWWAISGYPRYLLDSSSSRECCWCCWLAAMAYSSRSVAGDGDGDGDVDGGGLPATAVVMAVQIIRRRINNIISLYVVLCNTDFWQRRFIHRNIIIRRACHYMTIFT